MPFVISLAVSSAFCVGEELVVVLTVVVKPPENEIKGSGTMDQAIKDQVIIGYGSGIGAVNNRVGLSSVPKDYGRLLCIHK